MYANGTEVPDRYWVKKDGLTFAYKSLRVMCEEEGFSEQKMRELVRAEREKDTTFFRYGGAFVYLKKPKWYVEQKDNRFTTWTMPKEPSGMLLEPHSYEFVTWS